MQRVAYLNDANQEEIKRWKTSEDIGVSHTPGGRETHTPGGGEKHSPGGGETHTPGGREAHRDKET